MLKLTESEYFIVKIFFFLLKNIYYKNNFCRYLKQLRRNRDAENKLMKDVKGWKTGTLYGEPIYKTVSDEILIEPSLNEYYAHAPDKTSYDRVYWHKYL